MTVDTGMSEVKITVKYRNWESGQMLKVLDDQGR